LILGVVSPVLQRRLPVYPVAVRVELLQPFTTVIPGAAGATVALTLIVLIAVAGAHPPTAFGVSVRVTVPEKLAAGV
jgi:hypothetical protein